MQVFEAMTRSVRMAKPDQTIREACAMMMAHDSRALPVAEGDRLVGMVTDRDILVHAVARGRGPETLVRDVMSSDVRYCFDDEDTREVARRMGDQQIRRLPVVNFEKHLVGILSLADIDAENDALPAGEALYRISKRGSVNRQA